MRLPLPQLTVRQSMSLVIMMSVFAFLGSMFNRRVYSTRQAIDCATHARSYSLRSWKLDRIAKSNPSLAADYRDDILLCRQRAEYFLRRVGMWEEAAAHPWRALPRSEP